MSLLQKRSFNEVFYSGTSGLVLPSTKPEYPADFQGKSRLQYYASLFNSLEVNSIFYKLPKSSTIANWAESVPDHFRFTFKVSKAITHAKGLQFDPKDVDDFFEVVKNAGDKKGCLLAQFPPSLKIEKMDRLQSLLEAMNNANRNHHWKLALEFRDPSWCDFAVIELLEEYKVAVVIHDMQGSPTPWKDVNSDFIYLRFHGPEPKYRGNYSNEFLKQHAGHIKKWISDGKTVYVYFNNTVGAAFDNLQTLNQYVQT